MVLKKCRREALNSSSAEVGLNVHLPPETPAWPFQEHFEGDEFLVSMDKIIAMCINRGGHTDVTLSSPCLSYSLKKEALDFQKTWQAVS